MNLIDCLLMTLISGILCITFPLLISKIMGTKMNSTAPLRTELTSQHEFKKSSNFPKINTMKYALHQSSCEIEVIPNILSHNHNLRRKYQNRSKFI